LGNNAGPPAPSERTVEVRLGDRSYRISIGAGRLDRVGETLAEVPASGRPSRAVVVTDSNVRPLYAARACESLDGAGIPWALVEVPPGEKSKSARQLLRLWDEMLAAGVDRRSAVVALGGGVVGDLAGFVAATVLRGIPFLQVPTTLLAQVDSSVGGKTGIDHAKGKNLIGAFWQPAAVEIDPTTLSTLPARDLSAGLAEVVKTGVIRSSKLFGFVERNAGALLRCEPGPMTEVVAICCRTKAKIVGRDERDTSGERAVLNFGHTIGHAIESSAGLGRVLHGEAISIGMVAAGRMALRLDLWDEASEERLEALLARLGLPVGLGGLDLDEDSIMGRLLADKKTVAGRMHFVLPEEIGRASLREEPVPEKLVREVIRTLRAD